MRRMIYRVLVVLFVVVLFNISLAYGGTSSHKLNINKATMQELVSVKGIGEAKAGAVMRFIGEHKVVTDMDELSDVKGIGPKVLNNLKQKFEVKPGPGQ